MIGVMNQISHQLFGFLTPTTKVTLKNSPYMFVVVSFYLSALNYFSVCHLN